MLPQKLLTAPVLINSCGVGKRSLETRSAQRKWEQNLIFRKDQTQSRCRLIVRYYVCRAGLDAGGKTQARRTETGHGKPSNSYAQQRSKNHLVLAVATGSSTWTRQGTARKYAKLLKHLKPRSSLGRRITLGETFCVLCGPTMKRNNLHNGGNIGCRTTSFATKMSRKD